MHGILEKHHRMQKNTQQNIFFLVLIKLTCVLYVQTVSWNDFTLQFRRIAFLLFRFHLFHDFPSSESYKSLPRLPLHRNKAESQINYYSLVLTCLHAMDCEFFFFHFFV